MTAPPADGAAPSVLLREGLAHHRAGRLDAAAGIYRRILGAAPHHPDALHHLGLVLHQQGDSAGAVGMLEKAAVPLGGNPDFRANFGLALKDAGRWTRAREEFDRALAMDSGHGLALFNLGLLLDAEGDGAGAAALFARLVALEPQSAEARYLLARALAAAGRTDEARESFVAAAGLDPDGAEARLWLAEDALAAGRIDEAQSRVGEILARRPAALNALMSMAEIAAARGDDRGARVWLDKARAAEPKGAAVFYRAGLRHHEHGEFALAERAFRRCLLLDPAHAGMRWQRPRLLPAVYDSEERIEAARRAYAAGLEAIEAHASLDSPEAIEAAFEGLLTQANFYLPYQGRDDRDLQVRFGRLAARVMAARFPEFAAPPLGPAPEPDGKIRVGFFSSFFYRHTITRLYGGWLDGLDRSRFRVFAYHVRDVSDSVTRVIADRCDVFRQFDKNAIGDSSRPVAERFAAVCRAIAADRPHVLIFPDVGMDSATFCIAALRLARVQAASWGHPVTTGLPTMDYFLSSDLMEPEGGDKHYSEKLVRLPNLSVRLFDPGLAAAGAGKTRAAFGLKADEIVFLSSQSVFKYAPQYDRIYPAIARQAPGARFVFVRSADPAADRPLLGRLGRAFAAAGLDRDRHCRFLDRLPPGEFGDLNRAADIYLDTPGWSGGHTTFEAIAAGLPVVTLPGPFMRGRHSYAMLKMIGVEDTVAKDVDDYIAIAVRLGADEGWRRAVRAKIEANRGKLYDDQACVRGLEDFLVRAVTERGGKT